MVDGGEAPLRLEGGESGRVQVCWNGTWTGVLDSVVRTTQQANDICKLLNFLLEGNCCVSS